MVSGMVTDNWFWFFPHDHIRMVLLLVEKWQHTILLIGSVVQSPQGLIPTSVFHVPVHFRIAICRCFQRSVEWIRHRATGPGGAIDGSHSVRVTMTNIAMCFSPHVAFERAKQTPGHQPMSRFRTYHNYLKMSGRARAFCVEATPDCSSILMTVIMIKAPFQA